jgi:hypothetical protein
MSQLFVPLGGETILGGVYYCILVYPNTHISGGPQYWTIFFVYSPDYIFRNNARFSLDYKTELYIYSSTINCISISYNISHTVYILYILYIYIYI